jgi:hypothetical protein
LKKSTIKQNSDQQDDELMKAYSLQQKAWSGSSILKPDKKRLKPVTEAVFYQADFPTFLKERFEGRSVADVATDLDVDEIVVVNVLNGLWRPTKNMVLSLGLKTVYAISGELR